MGFPRLREIGRAHNRSAGEVASAWSLQTPAVTGAIAGARTARQERVMRSGKLHLTDQEVTEIEAFLVGTAT
jgi:aryl-alcohol dehydrogenase-like predicted oxidoreductase